jgi:hypothetical protein
MSERHKAGWLACVQLLPRIVGDGAVEGLFPRGAFRAG